MTLLLIRHGATTTSGKTYAGRSDVPLSDDGRREALGLARDLRDRPIALILSSPLGRAMSTAAPLARTAGLDIHTDPNLMEFDFGAYEGLLKASLGLSLRKLHAHTPVPAGEALIDVWARAGLLLDTLRRAPCPPDRDIAVFGHFWINRMIYGRASGMDFDAACRSRVYRPATGSVVELLFSADAPPTASRSCPSRAPAS